MDKILIAIALFLTIAYGIVLVKADQQRRQECYSKYEEANPDALKECLAKADRQRDEGVKASNDAALMMVVIQSATLSIN